ncbi:hypothetical protein [Halalkalibacterium halodurans]|uniref:hypothetical protein n=1 Tax=Halalkalibacterium halodurans TaxID=86665 RepID=UPI0005A207DC|nr:hypothetical protein [Halalkalibacterium halodurans]MED4107531.1 hypothetical protein [Halalkalibacterium halodurans]MED4122876.1 hypothetical protein [Halalkalibacterium halodurans]MED4150272.1 hypothetical protein [Halalkalibacterium halodurans]MED4189686.1 hypothetical protein [Halalkalibacterium halodurans]
MLNDWAIFLYVLSRVNGSRTSDKAATPAGKATAEDRREWSSRGSWSVARGKENTTNANKVCVSRCCTCACGESVRQVAI